MTLPLEQNAQEQASTATNSSTLFVALVGAIAGGVPQLILPTATLVEFIGNALMGAVVVGILDGWLIRKTLPDYQLKKGRMLAILFVSVALTVVTYRSPSRVFQDVFDAAPPEGVRSLAAAAYTADRPGNIGYRMSFVADPISILKIEERMEKLDIETFDPAKESWEAWVARTIPANSSMKDAAEKLGAPKGLRWTSEKAGRKITTTLYRDSETNITLVEHVPG